MHMPVFALAVLLSRTLCHQIYSGCTLFPALKFVFKWQCLHLTTICKIATPLHPHLLFQVPPYKDWDQHEASEVARVQILRRHLLSKFCKYGERGGTCTTRRVCASLNVVPRCYTYLPHFGPCPEPYSAFLLHFSQSPVQSQLFKDGDSLCFVH